MTTSITAPTGKSPVEWTGVIRAGIWTPWATILCRSCYEAKHADQPLPLALRRRPALQCGLEEGQGATVCDGCGKPVAVDEIIAREHQLVRTLQARRFRAYMKRLEDGNSAACVHVPRGSFLLIHADVDDWYYIMEHDLWGIWVPRRDREVQGLEAAVNLVEAITRRKLQREPEEE